MSTHTPGAVLFDLDGTLADTLPVCFAAFRHAWRDKILFDLVSPLLPHCFRGHSPWKHVSDRSRKVQTFQIDAGAPRPVKMGTIASPWRYDVEVSARSNRQVCDTPRSSTRRRELPDIAGVVR